jgi:uncharacterized protein YjiS (DUF1127 family)
MADVMTDFTWIRRETRRAAGPLARLLARLRQRRSERLALYRLRGMDDHLLRDIGVTREGIAERVHRG